MFSLFFKANSLLISTWYSVFQLFGFAFLLYVTRPGKSLFLVSIWEICMLEYLLPVGQSKKIQDNKFYFLIYQPLCSFILTFLFSLFPLFSPTVTFMPSCEWVFRALSLSQSFPQNTYSLYPAPQPLTWCYTRQKFRAGSRIFKCCITLQWICSGSFVHRRLCFSI